MKRLWLGIGLFVLLLAGSIAVSVGMERIHEPIARRLEQAADTARAGDGETAAALAEEARAAWEKRRNVTAAFCDHMPMEEIDRVFGELTAHEKAGNMPEFAAACDGLVFLVRAMGEAHSLTWGNFLQANGFPAPAQ